MNYIQKRIWVAWRKFRFLKLPVEKRVRLEVTTDGRHITFLLVSLYEAGYGVQVFGSQFVFRELMLLRKSAPIPFLYGGKERECGISITDKSGFNHRGHSEHGEVKRLQLDYDYFSGLNKGWVSHGGTANTEVGEDRGKNESRENFNHGLHNRAPGQARDGATEGRPEGRGSGNERVKYTRIEAEQAGLRLASQASASEPDYLTSKLAHAPVSESLIRSADGPTSSLDTGHSPPATALRAPYFMHPSVYHRGLHKSQLAERSKHVPCFATVQALDFGHTPPVTSYPPQRRRRFRIGFFGTHDREFYTKHYHFPGMNRFEILEVFLQKFANRMKPIRGFPRDWDPCEIAVSIDGRGGDRRGKTFLSQDHYFEALRECDFVLSPPGWCMPLSHNLIEAVFCGAIPITNGGAFMVEPLKDRVNCLEFHDEEGLTAAVERALAMGVGKVSRMQQAVRDYYERFLEPEAWFPALIGLEVDRFLVNAEEKSVPLAEGFHVPALAFPEKNAN